MYHGSLTQNVYRCNCIKNIHTNKAYLEAIVYEYFGWLYLNNSILSLNVGSTLFFNMMGFLYVDQCYLDNPSVGKTSSGGEVSLELAEIFDLGLPHLIKEICSETSDFPNNPNFESFDGNILKFYKTYLSTIMHYGMCITSNLCSNSYM